MNSSWLLLGGVGVGALFNQIKDIFIQIRSIILPSMVIQWSQGGQRLCSLTSGYLLNNFSKYRLSSCNTYLGRYSYLKQFNKFGIVPTAVLNETFTLFWYKGKPIIVKKDDKTWSIHIIYIRFTFNPDAFMTDLTNWLASIDTENRFVIKRLSGSTSKFSNNSEKDKPGDIVGDTMSLLESDYVVGWDRSHLGESNTTGNDPVDALGLSEDTMLKLDRIMKWYKSKQWYMDRMIPWRRGVLLEGPPGSGKSALVKALGQKFNIPIYVLDISTMDNTEFYDNYRKAKTDSPCIILIEDIDSVFDGRTNTASKQGCGVTFDCLLNEISGVESSDGVLLAITTNNKDKIDPALSGVVSIGDVTSRPGRIDDILHMGPLSKESRTKLATRYMAGLPELLINKIIAEGDGDTGAQFQDRCNNIALSYYWENVNEKL